MRRSAVIGALAALAACHDGTGPALSGTDLRYASIAAGNQFTCALTRDGRAFCWGDDFYGQLGTQVAATYSLAPVMVGGDHRFRALFASGSSACGIAADQAVWCWGLNGAGQLGAPSAGCSTVFTGTDCSAPPARISSSSQFRMVGLFGGASCGVTTAAGLECWGTNYWLPPLRTDPPPTSVPDSGKAHAQIALGDFHACAAMTDGSMRCWGLNYYGALGMDTAHGQDTLVCPGRQCVRPVRTALGHTWSAVAAAAGQTCGLTTDGSAFCWGDNTYGQLGHNGITSSFVPAAVDSGFKYSAISMGPQHTCGLRQNATGWCWGANPDGRLGYQQAASIAWSPVRVGALANVVSISAGSTHGCAVTNDGRAFCWGTNKHGELGTGDTVSTRIPVQVLPADTTR